MAGKSDPHKKVVIYTASYCPYCHAAKKFLQAKKVKFEEIDVTDDDTMRDKLIRMTGRETVPQIFVGGRSIGGYDELVAFTNQEERYEKNRDRVRRRFAAFPDRYHAGGDPHRDRRIQAG